MSALDTIDHLNRYLNTTTGREKLCRLVQYFARFYAFYLFRVGGSKVEVERWSNLKSHIANGRKFFRLLKPIEFGRVAHKSLTVPDEILRATAVLKQIGMALYYSSEVFVLTNAIGFYKPANIQKITDFGQKCWFLGILASLLSGLYKFKQLGVRRHLLEKAQKNATTSEEKASANLAEQAKALAKDYHTTGYAFVQDIVDITIPSSNLKWLGFDEGMIGIAG
ncbi:peroxisomal biogenesis factor 11 [Syncephalastrum racemosum]|uniref:Peroxisomal biogenesis factor 11 n=1 Tax=Syncephalastrum racemosum TaxID=13706 RepID=A0A1X2HGF6_SYNRA|nr:peroxisomal biogenesis factor 11 [Syncephalastrum racemosum]